MFFKLFLMKLDHFFTERLNHWIGQLKYGKEIDFSIPNLKRGGTGKRYGLCWLSGKCFDRFQNDQSFIHIQRRSYVGYRLRQRENGFLF